MNDEFTLPEDEKSQDLNQVAAAGDARVIDDVEFVAETVEPSPRPPGPGLPESLGWTAGVLITLFGTSVVWTILFIIYLTATGRPINPDIDAMMSGMSVNERIMMFLPASLLAFVVLIPLGLWRLGRGRLQKLNLSPPSFTQLVIVLAAVYPTTFITTPIFESTDVVWIEFSEGTFLDFINEQSVMKMMEYLQGGSLLLLLFFLAVVPAVGEEFMFRGVIGRGLTARWGVWWGVLITSFLFALVHMYPPHVAAVLPIGIMMHVVYLATRSFWAPVLFHFANNALASIGLAMDVETEEEMLWWMLPAALAYLAVSIALLYRYRTRYVNDEGEEISPGYVTVAKPPAEVAARRVAPVGWVAAPLFALVLAGTVFFIANDLVTSVDAKPAPEETETARHAESGAHASRFGMSELRDRDSRHSPHLIHDCRINA